MHHNPAGKKRIKILTLFFDKKAEKWRHKNE